MTTRNFPLNCWYVAATSELERVQAQRDGDPLTARDVNVTADRAGLKARRVVHAMVAEEAGRAPVRPWFAQLAGA